MPLPRGSIDQSSGGATSAAAGGGGTLAVAAAPYVTSKMEVEAAENGRPIPKLCCPTCGVTRELELIEQPTGAPKIRYISGPTYVSTGRRGGDFVQKCNCKKCGHFYLTPLPNDDAAATTAASASAGAAAAAPAVTVAPAVTAAPPAATATSAAASASAVAQPLLSSSGTGRLPRLSQLYGKRLRFGSFIGEVVSTRQRANRDSRVGILWRQAWAADPRCRKCRKCASCPDLGDGSLTFEDDLSVQDVLTRLCQQESEGVVYPSERYTEEIRQGTKYQATIPAITVGVSGDDGGGEGAERGGDQERLAGLVETVIEVLSSMEHPGDAVQEVLRALPALAEKMSCS